MAKIGFEYVAAALLDTSVSKSLATAKYTEGREIGPAAAVNSTPTSSDVKDYGDDRTVATDASVTGGTLSLELNEPTMENEAWILGHTFDKENNSMLRNTGDVAPYIGVGFIGKSKGEDNKIKYKAKVYLKSQFKEPNDENATKQESVTFSHSTMEGNMYQLENGDWKTETLCDTLDVAKTYVNKILCITSSASESTGS